MQNSELLTLTYGALVTQLLRDYESVDEVNKKLDQMCTSLSRHHCAIAVAPCRYQFEIAATCCTLRCNPRPFCVAVRRTVLQRAVYYVVMCAGCRKQSNWPDGGGSVQGLQHWAAARGRAHR